jgi:general secretion pathway protein D
VTTRIKLGILVAGVLLSGGCAAGSAFRHGNVAMRAGDLDQAVAYYRTAVQASPDNPNYKIALQRAMAAASYAHLEKARQFEQHDQLEAARGEYKLASEYDPTNRQAAEKVAALDQTIRARTEAARPRPPIEALREQARQAAAPPLLNPASREPLIVNFQNVPSRDILTFIANTTGINITYDRDAQVDRPMTLQLDNVTLEQALNQILTMNQLSYKIVTDRSIFIFPDTVQKHTQFDDQVIQTFYLSNADPTELTNLISTLVRLPGMAVQPMIQPNKAANSITVRGTSAVVRIIEKIIQQNDKPRAEIIVDVEILK